MRIEQRRMRISNHGTHYLQLFPGRAEEQLALSGTALKFKNHPTKFLREFFDLIATAIVGFEVLPILPLAIQNGLQSRVGKPHKICRSGNTSHLANQSINERKAIA